MMKTLTPSAFIIFVKHKIAPIKQQKTQNEHYNDEIKFGLGASGDSDYPGLPPARK